MKIAAALEHEKIREEKDNWSKIYLHKDGKFFRAYEWSAWLIKMFVCTEEFQKERGDEKILAANRYVTKKGEYVCVGFPLESISKYMPNFGDVDFNNIEDFAEFDIEIGDSEDVTFETLSEKFMEWKQSLPEKVTKQAKSHTVVANIDTGNGRAGMFQILSQVMSYPLESRTPSENAEFISSLKRQLAALL